MRLAVLWKGPSGYINACIDALSQHLGTDLLFLVYGSHSGAPFSTVLPQHLGSFALEAGAPSVAERLDTFQPDVLLVSGWDASEFMDAVRHWRGRCRCLLFMDNQWLGTPKQYLGRATRRVFVQRHFDGVMVPGERQVMFAEMLGFKPERIITGGYSCDTAAFHPKEVRDSLQGERRSFLACNRMVPSKGISNLLDAYQRYRSAVKDPWDLVLSGVGPSLAGVNSVPGVRSTGFVQPSEIPVLFQSANAFVLASHFEPWGVVVHEAATTGLPVICTTAVGAGVHLVAHGANGYVVPTKRPDLFADAMVSLGNKSAAELAAMGAISRNLASAFSPARWTANVLELCRRSGEWDTRRKR